MDIYKELDRLNPRQKEAVMHTEGPLLVLAGAGSGKTRVITMRTAYLINSGVDPASILDVTFTNKAAREMQGRVKTMVPSGAGLPVISTFHSICLRILRKEIDHLGYKKDFTIYDTSEQLSLMRNIMSDIKFYDKSFKPESILERISWTKNDYVQQESDDSDDSIEEASELIYPRYLEALKTMNVLDFDDLLLLTLKLFKSYPDVLDKYRDRFRYLMVDEYQDTNSVQYGFIKLLAGKRRNLCVVGDDDQSIYGWRGADISNILNFDKDFPGTLVVRLEQNYRSFDNILKAANGVIKNNTSRMEKSLWTERGDGPKVNIFKAEDTEDEAEWIADRISIIKDQKNISYEDVAVIYRANTFSRPFEEALRSKQIPYTVVGGTSYFERREIRDIVAWLKIIANPSDDLSLLRAISAPRRGLGASALKLLADFARSKSINLLESFGRADEIEGLSKRALSSAETFYSLIDRYREILSKGKKMAITVKDLLDEINFRDYINHLYKDPVAAFRRIENLEGLVESIGHYESKNRSPSIQGFLESMALSNMLEEKEEKKVKGVTLISFHSSKGLEFPIVFIVGAEEELIPHKKSVHTSSGVEEERRLFYVGITRAMKELFITYTEKRRKYGKEKLSVPSRFIKEIPGDVSVDTDRFVKMEPEEEKAYVKSMYENFMARFEE